MSTLSTGGDSVVSVGMQGYQAAILVEFNDNSRMFPLLADDYPLCLLPVGKLLGEFITTLLYMRT